MEPPLDAALDGDVPPQPTYPADHPLNSHWIVKLGWLERLSEDWNTWWPQASERFTVPFALDDFEPDDGGKVPQVIWDTEQASRCLDLFNGRVHSTCVVVNNNTMLSCVVLAFVAATLWAPQGEEAPVESVETALSHLEEKFIESFIKIRRHFGLRPSPHLFMKSLWDTLGGPGCLDRMMPAYPARWPTLSRGVPTAAQSLEKAERPPLPGDIDDWKHQLKAILTRSTYDIDEFVVLIKRYPGSEVDGFVLSALYSMVHDWGWTDNHSEFQEAVTSLTEQLGRRFLIPLIRIRFHFNLMEGMNRYTRELSGSPYLRRIDERLLVDLVPDSMPPLVEVAPLMKRTPPSSLAPGGYRRTPSSSSLLAVPPSPAPTISRLRDRSPSPSRGTRRNSSPTRPEVAAQPPSLPHVKPTSQVPHQRSASGTRRSIGHGHQRVHSSGGSSVATIRSQAQAQAGAQSLAHAPGHTYPPKEVPARIPSPARPPVAHTHAQPKTHFPAYTAPTYSYTRGRGLSHRG
ncbi:uncharacterized protein LOC62_03G005079 [Vanrija pseudolonga]|uniref:Uncharacterized protein n=1 Tax=Vanrija pseudolonga TaxID=143232 RepID=A0AAF0Y8Z8_9TREE|nr:hypothetical protein LOC62_03G005079 [Vanrija pseudolonga]